ncbi:MAG: hypothetical protein CSB47_06795 [Proteobacteria bacterium]|nr:MAG: hypothetical protein CSB47_06795 [Pseudomonadota bacterium]
MAGAGGVACSNIEQRRAPEPNVRTLPPSSVIAPQRRSQLPQNSYIPPEFEEYKPQALPQYQPPLESFESYVPEKDYESAYTTPLNNGQLAMVDKAHRVNPSAGRSKPKPVVSKPVKQKPVEDLSKYELDIDPFADVPDREVSEAQSKSNSSGLKKPAPVATKHSLSAAANALLLAAKAESAVGRHGAAMTKVERALRIEPQSALLWYELASLNYKSKIYDQAINLARKSLQLSTGNRSLVNKNLDLMSKAATKQGNTQVFSEVLDYKKMNL